MIEPADQYAYIYVQCRTWNGELGTFIGRNEGRGPEPLSPVFADLTELYPWMRENGWVSAEYKRIIDLEKF